MKISKESILFMKKELINFNFECGGILGSSGKEIIDNIILDKASNYIGRRCSYSPNTDYLNKCILQWQNENVRFLGMFHTHFVGVKTMSDADKKYIELIMSAMPEEIGYLYFPIFVLPHGELCGYVAKKVLNGVQIFSDEVIIK